MDHLTRVTKIKCNKNDLTPGVMLSNNYNVSNSMLATYNIGFVFKIANGHTVSRGDKSKVDFNHIQNQLVLYARGSLSKCRAEVSF